MLEPFGAKIDMGRRLLELGKRRLHIPMIKTSGGHFVLPLEGLVPKKDDTGVVDIDTPKDNIRRDEAEAVMSVLFSQLNDTEELKKLHDEVGHQVFVEIGLKQDDEAKVMKVHRYFGHRSSRRIWELFAKAGKLPGKRKQVLDLIDNCETCSKLRKGPSQAKSWTPCCK